MTAVVPSYLGQKVVFTLIDATNPATISSHDRDGIETDATFDGTNKTATFTDVGDTMEIMAIGISAPPKDSGNINLGLSTPRWVVMFKTSGVTLSA